ncbi:MAG: Qat anti-phage system TatD family nuclease QatD [Pseudomonadota bacterium]|jgi:TatD DNase family protein|nr:TatD family hydrolase [Burkholderiaceae bacterium]
MDFHCHIDLYPNPREVYRQAIERNEFTWLVTTSPRAFEATSKALTPSPKVLITPGLHPELAHQRAAELPLLLEQVSRCSAVGEIGLDGSARFKEHAAVQFEIFESVVARCAQLGGRVLSIHSRHAADHVLDVLRAHPAHGTAVLHWFSGTTGQLKRAADMGCWFSVGPAMFTSASGRKLASLVPRDRVVSESDGPFGKVAGQSVMPWEAHQATATLAREWQVSTTKVSEGLSRNGRGLLAKIRGS